MINSLINSGYGITYSVESYVAVAKKIRRRKKRIPQTTPIFLLVLQIKYIFISFTNKKYNMKNDRFSFLIHLTKYEEEK